MSIQQDYNQYCEFDKNQLYGGQPGWYRMKDWNVSTGSADESGKLHGTQRRPVCCPNHYNNLPTAEKENWEPIP